MSDVEAAILKFLDNPFYVGASAVGLLLLLVAVIYREQVLFNLRFVRKSLYRNLLRSILTALATMVLVLIITLVWSVFALLDRVTQAKTRDFKVVVTERWQFPSQMPFAYASTLVTGAASEPGDHRVDPDNDAMTWQFVGGTLDPLKRSFDNFAFFFAMEPNKFLTMMDDIDQFTEEQKAAVERATKEMQGDPRKVVIGVDRLKSLKKQVGDRFKLTSMTYKDLEFEVEVIGVLPSGRYGQSGLMNREYLSRTLDDYERKRGAKHPLAEKTLNLVWLRVPNNLAFQKVAGQIEGRGLYTSPSVKCETASSGIASFLDAYRDLLWGMRWLLVPAALFTMALVIANAISISVRERRTEMAVLKVLGFPPGRIMGLVLSEAVLVGSISGLISGAGTYLLFNGLMGGVPFPIAFFSVVPIPASAWWWGAVIGASTALVGSLLPAWSARSVKVAEVFAKIS